MTAVLSGIRVVELGTMITAPLAGMMLADLGADVIKIERPDGGDPFRSFRGGLYSPHFTAYNRNKRSMTLDLQKPEGREILKRLLGTSDVLLENYRPEVLTRLDLQPDQLMSEFPELIVCSITGFGPAGPYSRRPAYDAVATALSGMYSILLDPKNPRTNGPTIADNVTGMYACNGILAALLGRERTQQGSFTPDPFANYTQLGIESDARTRVATSQSFALRCADGKLLAVHLSSPQKFWDSLMAALGREDLQEDPRFSTRDGRVRNFSELEDCLAAEFATKKRADWMQILDRHDVPFAPIQSIAEVLNDPQVRHLGTFYKLSHPQQGEVVGIERPIWIDGGRAINRRPPPTLGEHSEELLAELGFGSEKVQEFKAKALL
jgi:formyl-CoA transferase